MNSARIVGTAWLAASLAAAGWLIPNLSVRTDLSSFMPRGASVEDRLLLAELRAGPASRIILISLLVDDAKALAKRSRTVAKQLRDSGLFSRVMNGEQLLGPGGRATIFAKRYLLSSTVTAARFSSAGLEAALRARLRELKRTFTSFNKGELARDPTAEFNSILARWRPSAHPHSRFGVWTNGDGTRAVFVAETRAPGFDLRAQEQALAAIRGVIALGNPSGGLEALKLTGPGVFAVASRDTIREESRTLAIAASAAVAVILLVSFRRASILVLATLPLATALVFATLAVQFLFAGIHAITIAFGTTVIGVVIDYPIHLFSHLPAKRDSTGTFDRTNSTARTGPTASTDPIELTEPAELAELAEPANAAADIWPTLRLSALTTATGYLAMSNADFPGLQELAAFAILGILVAAGFTRWGLPGLIPGRAYPGAPTLLRSATAALFVPRRWLQGSVAALGIAALVVLFYRPSVWQDDIAALSPIPTRVFAEDRGLRAQLGIPDVNYIAVLRGASAQVVLEASERVAQRLRPLIADGTVGSVDLAARYLPSVRTQQRRQAALPTPAVLSSHLHAALSGLPFRADAFAPFQAAVEAARSMPAVHVADIAGTVLGARVQSSLYPVDGVWRALINFSDVRNPEALERHLADSEESGLTFINVKRDTSRLLGAFREQALRRIALGVVIMVVVVWVGLGSLQGVVRALAPGFIAAVFTLAVLSLMEEPLTLFHLVSGLLVVGISIDYGLFFGRDERDAEARARTTHGIAVCAASTVCVFGLLSTSALPVLNAIGTTVAVGAVASFVCAMALSRGPVAGSRGLCQKHPLPMKALSRREKPDPHRAQSRRSALACTGGVLNRLVHVCDDAGWCVSDLKGGGWGIFSAVAVTKAQGVVAACLGTLAYDSVSHSSIYPR